MREVRGMFSEVLRELAKRERVLILIQVVLSVLIPAAVGYVVTLLTSSQQEIRTIGIVLLVFLIAIQAALLIAVLVGPSTPARAVVALKDAHDNYEQLNDRYETLEDQRNSYFSSVLCTNQALEVVRGIADSEDTEVNTEMLEQELERILTPYVEEKDLVFNFSDTAGSKYRVTVLIHDEESDALTQRYSYADPGIVRRGRSWQSNKGHAGRAFTEQKVIITPDLAQVEEYRDYYDETDKSQYRSMASIPLMVDEKVVGVLVVTSSSPHQFNYENSVQIFETMGHILSVYLGYTGMQEVR
jgi:GAF domain-containing protein